MTTNEPTSTPQAGLTLEGGDYATMSLGGYVSGPVADSLDGRLAVQQYRSDGYVHNEYLNRDDTNNFDELTLNLCAQAIGLAALGVCRANGIEERQRVTQLATRDQRAGTCQCAFGASRNRQREVA